jgi:hypothetical protein
MSSKTNCSPTPVLDNSDMATTAAAAHRLEPRTLARHVRIAAAGLVAAVGLGLGGLTTSPVSAQAAETAVVFPFELLDSAQEGELFPKVRPEETKRLALLTADLTSRLQATGRYAPVATDPLAADIKAAAPIHRCNGCEADLAKKAGAALAVVGVVQKFSDTLLSVNIQISEAATGKVRAAYSAGIQGNTDEAWLRGVSYIVRNRIATQGASP